MEYHHEVLDRASGRLATKSIGDWITITELGERHCVGSKTVRAILHHMGVLAQESRRYRLPRHLVEAGIGIRHDRPQSGHPFDVISPMGQELIASVWCETADDYQAECQKDAVVPLIMASLASFNTTRRTPLDTRQEVYWILDHFPDVQFQTAALALEVSPAIVTRYAAERSKRRRELREARAEPLEEVKREVGDEVQTCGLSSTAPIESCCLPEGEAPVAQTITQGLYIPKNDRRPSGGWAYRLSPRLRSCHVG